MVLASQRHLKKSLGLGPGCTLGAQLAGRASQSSAERWLLHHNLVPDAQAQGPGQHSLTVEEAEASGPIPEGSQELLQASSTDLRVGRQVSETSEEQRRRHLFRALQATLPRWFADRFRYPRRSLSRSGS